MTPWVRERAIHASNGRTSANVHPVVCTMTTDRERPVVGTTSSARSNACGITSSGTDFYGGEEIRPSWDVATNRAMGFHGVDAAAATTGAPRWLGSRYRRASVAALAVVVAVLVVGKVSFSFVLSMLLYAWTLCECLRTTAIWRR